MLRMQTIVFLCCTRGVCVMAGVGVVPSDDALEAVTLQAYRELNKSSAQSITKTEFTDWVLRFAASGSSSSKEVSLDAALHQFGVVQQLHDEPSNLAPELETKLPAFPHEQDASLLDDRSDDHGYDPGVNDLDKDAECAKSGSTLTSAQFDEEYNIPDDAVQQECTRAAESTPELPASKTLEADNPSVDDTDTAENNPWGDNEAIDATEDSVGEGDDYNDEATTTTRSRPQSSRPAHSEDDNAADELQEAAKTVDDVIDTIVKSDAGEPVGDTENEMPSGVSPAVDDGNDQDGDNYDDEFAEASQASVNIVQPPLESKIDDSQSFDEYADTELPTPDKIGDEKTAPQDDISKEISIHTETPHDFDEQAHTIMPSESEKVETPSNPTDLNAYDTYDYENSAFSSASGLPPPDPPELTLSQDDSATEHTPDNDGIRIEPTQ